MRKHKITYQKFMNAQGERHSFGVTIFDGDGKIKEQVVFDSFDKERAAQEMMQFINKKGLSLEDFEYG